MMKTVRCCAAIAAFFHVGAVRAGDAPVFPPDSYMAKIQQRGALNAGVKAEMPGIGYLNPRTGKFEGFVIDLSTDLAERMFGQAGHVAYRPTLPITRIPMLQQGLIDATLETMFITKERWKQVDFAEPYWGAPLRIMVQKSNNTIKTIADLKDRLIGSTKASSSEAKFRNPNSGFPPVRLVMFDSTPEAIEAVRVGRVEAAVFDEVLGLPAMKVAPNEFKYVGENLSYDYYGIGVAQGHAEFVDYINVWLREIKANGKWAQFYKQNLPGDVPEPPMPPFDKAFYR
jgi:aspartate/glutamate/glutamine transport system substrate-binding protein